MNGNELIFFTEKKSNFDCRLDASTNNSSFLRNLERIYSNTANKSIVQCKRESNVVGLKNCNPEKKLDEWKYLCSFSCKYLFLRSICFVYCSAFCIFLKCDRLC